MDQAALLIFDDTAQSTYEACYPAQITVPGFVNPITCAGGTSRQVAVTLTKGGAVSEFDFVFRVRKSSLGNTLPEVGTLITYQGRQIRIMRATDPDHSVAYLLGCANAIHPH